MELHVFRHLWGVLDPREAVFPRIKQQGFRGIESGLPPAEQREAFRALLGQHGFDYIAGVFTAGRTVEEHVASFRQQLEGAAALRPRLVNCHAGSDAWSDADGARFFEQVLAIEADLGLPVAHETHRARILYNPWAAQRLMDRFERLKLCCDLSHWVCVCARLLDDAAEIIQQAAERCLHIHARVGFEHGPQVPDPRAPEYQAQVEAHERWWCQMWAAQRARGLAAVTATPEYGPPRYLHTLPFTDVPVTDLWAVCEWQANRLMGLFASQPNPDG